MPAAIGWPLIIVLVAFWLLIRMERKPKDNIRVPRETLWGKTNKYFGDTQ